MRTAIALLCGVLTINGCSGPSEPLFGDVTMTPLTDSYVPQYSVVVGLSNRSFTSIEFAQCPLALERLTGLRWTVVAGQQPCVGLQHSLAPGSRTELQYYLPSSVGAGTYRLVHEVYPARSRTPWRIRSSPFKVVTNIVID